MHLAALIYRGMLYKLKEHFYYTKHKLFETPGFRRIISQNKMQNFYILLIMRSSLFLTTKSPKFSQYWKNSWYVSNYYVSWRAIYPLMSPFSCGRNALVENNTFLKRDHVSDWKNLFCQKDLPAMFGTLFGTHVVILSSVKTLIPITVQPRY